MSRDQPVLGRDRSRSRNREVAILIAVLCLVWVAGATLVFRSGGFNPAGLVPALGCIVALWAAVRGDAKLMWLGTGVVVISSVLFVFSLGLVVVPAAVGLLVGSLILSRRSTG